jgi:hypothetical protein
MNKSQDQEIETFIIVEDEDAIDEERERNRRVQIAFMDRL